MKKTVLKSSAVWEMGCNDIKPGCDDITPFDLSQARREIGRVDIEVEEGLTYFKYSKVESSWGWPYMLQKEFAEPTSEIEVPSGVGESLIESLGVETAREVLKQKEVLAEKMPLLQGAEGKDVVVCEGEIFLGNTFNEALRNAREKHGDRPFYSTKIKGIPEFPSIYSL